MCKRPTVYILPVLGMKRFTARLILFLFIGFIVVQAYPFYKFYSGKYQEMVEGKYVYSAIKQSLKKSDKRKLLIGDSVVRQLFPNTKQYKKMSSLACNQAISMVGYYILLNNFLNCGNQIDTLYMCYTPYIFQNNLDSKFTFHYFLKPFYQSQFKCYLDSVCCKQIKDIPFYQLSKYPTIAASNWSPRYKANTHEKRTFFSPIALNYFQKIIDLSEEYQFTVKLFPPLLAKSKRNIIPELDIKEIDNQKITNLFKEYTDQYVFLPDSCFLDGVHLDQPQKYRQYFLRKMGGIN